ncbi:MAG: ABC transporter permease [Gammaproteobacteria bacterium]|nr:ABC transporter permease [Gammaproteobacteria bacterium]
MRRCKYKVSTHYLEFIWYRSLAQLRSESSRAYLGYLWWVLEPLLHLVVFYIVFALVLNRGDKDYVQVLLTGLVVWKWIDASVRSSMDSISQNAALIDKVYLPKIVFPSVSVLSNGIKFGLTMALLLLYSYLFGKGISLHWVALPLLIFVQSLLVYSAACLVAAVSPFLPDIKIIFDKVMTLAFFMSGIFYTAESIPESIRGYFLLNPAFSLIECYRDVLINHQWPSLMPLFYMSVFSAVIFVIAAAILRRFDRVYPRLIY